jgi:choline transport protein
MLAVQELVSPESECAIFGLQLNQIIVIYGFLLVFILQSFLGASLAEFVSSYPTEGGMYHWTAAIAPRRASGFLSFVTGWCSVAGCV